MLALELSDGIVANEAVYQRLVRDIAAIRALEPKVKGITYFRPHDGRELILMLDKDAEIQFRSAQYHAWDCLNQYYGATKTYSLGRSSAVVRLKGLYNTRKLGELYSALPGVKVAETGMSITSGGHTNIYVTPNGDEWHYVFNGMAGWQADTERAAYYFVVGADGVPRFAGRWAPPGPTATRESAPEWLETYGWQTQLRWQERAFREGDYANDTTRYLNTDIKVRWDRAQFRFKNSAEQRRYLRRFDTPVVATPEGAKPTGRATAEALARALAKDSGATLTRILPPDASDRWGFLIALPDDPQGIVRPEIVQKISSDWRVYSVEPLTGARATK